MSVCHFWCRCKWLATLEVQQEMIEGAAVVSISQPGPGLSCAPPCKHHAHEQSDVRTRKTESTRENDGSGQQSVLLAMERAPLDEQKSCETESEHPDVLAL